MTVKLTERALNAISEHAEGTKSNTACGLLIGQRDADGLLVDRSLRCFNAAPGERRSSSFEIDARVLVNVRRSIAGTGSSVLGFYYASDEPDAQPSSLDLEHLRLWPDTVLLIRRLGDDSEPGFRAWSRSSAASAVTELMTEVIPARTTSMLICPE